MPELPEVETIVRQLRPLLVGRRFSTPKITRPDVLRGVTAARLISTLRGRTVVTLDRRAKHAVIRLDSDDRLVIQLRMTGSLQVFDRRLTAAQHRYVVFRVGIGSGATFVFRDVRRLGTVSLLDEQGWYAYTGRIGPEPLAPDFSATRFMERMQGTRQAVKKAIMDQRRLAGVGNIYASEALFGARIDPSCRTDHLTRDEFRRLHRSVRSVLRAAIAKKGTTVRDYRTGTGEEGAFQHHLRVYGRGGLPCLVCGTLLTTTHAIDGRTTTFCWRCQRRRA